MNLETPFLPTPQTTSLPFLPYRSKKKLNKLGVFLNDYKPLPTIDKKVKRQTTLHHVHGSGTWMCDYFFIRPTGEIINDPVGDDVLTFLPLEPTPQYKPVMIGGKPCFILLCFIHCNTRFVEIFPVRTRNQSEFLASLITLKQRQPQFNTLISDMEKAFSSRSINDFYQHNGITHIHYNTNNQRGARSDHLKLSIIDRFARTLRDMIFNSKRTNPSFQLSEQTLPMLVHVYNNTPHSTLSKVMNFDVSPQQAFEYEDLQNEIMRRIVSENYSTTESYEYNRIESGNQVYLHKPHVFGEKRRADVEDNPYRVVGRRRGGFILSGPQGVLTETVYINNQPHTQRKLITRSEITVPSS